MAKKSTTSPSNLPKRYAQYGRLVNEDWNTGRPPPSNPTETDLNNYILYQTAVYQNGTLTDDELHERFANEFTTWTQQFFDRASSDLARERRSVLRHRGVYVASDRRRVSLNLALAINSQNEWPPEEIEKQKMKGPGFHDTSTYARSYYPTVQVQSEPSTAPTAPTDVAPTMPMIPRSTTPIVGSSTTPLTTRAKTPTLPPSPAKVESNSRLISELMRGYQHQDKYGGEKYKFLIKKFELFTSHCEMIGLKAEKRLKAIQILLTG